jgi:hypothetical protein
MASHCLSDRQKAARDREFNREALEREKQVALQDRRAATALVTIWNARRAAGRELWFYPTIGAAIAAGRPLLRYYCPGCGQTGAVDLHKMDRHRGATIESLIPTLSCRRCQPHPPFVKLLGLAAVKPRE